MSIDCTGDNESNIFCELYHYTFQKNIYLFILFSALIVVLCFYYMALVADNYLSHCVSRLVQRIGLSQTLAGATLLAFANGSNDVISAFTAAGTPEGIPLAIGSIFGSGIVNFSVTSSVVLITSEKIHLCKKSFVRDVAFFALGTCYVVCLGLYGTITLTNVLGFYLIYAMYLGTLMLMEKQSKKEEAENFLEDNIFGETTEPIVTMNNIDVVLDEESPKSHITSREMSKEEKFSDRDISIDQYQAAETRVSRAPSYSVSLDSISIENPRQEEERRYYIMNENESEHRDSTGPGGNYHSETAQSFISHQVREDYKGIIAEKILYYAGLPWIFLCNLTIPSVDSRRWNKIFAIVQVFGSVWLFLVVNKLALARIGGTWIGFLVIPLQLVFAINVYYRASPDFIHNYLTFASLVGLVSAISWLELISLMVIEFIQFVGTATGLNPVYLGMTLVAFGYTLSDIISNRALARNGLELTGYTACFAGPLFNLLIGLSTSFLRQVLEYGKVDFRIFDFRMEAMKSGSLFVVGILMIVFLSLCINLAIALFNDFRLKNSDSRVMLGFYVFCMVIATTYSVILLHS